MDREKIPDMKPEWWSCPECGKNLFMIQPGAVIKGMQIKCRGCRRIIQINIEEPLSR